ncbi:hypothetical protein EIM50_00630 [Pseudoxanthomonas sp. SGD-10]|nr:hypothetical protein EIM50_00630 [Pseudoxanthomonas sp. SGD-10]
MPLLNRVCWGVILLSVVGCFFALFQAPPGAIGRVMGALPFVLVAVIAAVLAVVTTKTEK